MRDGSRRPINPTLTNPVKHYPSLPSSTSPQLFALLSDKKTPFSKPSLAVLCNPNGITQHSHSAKYIRLATRQKQRSCSSFA